MFSAYLLGQARAMSPFAPTATQREKFHHYPHSTDEKTEGPRGLATFLGQPSQNPAGSGAPAFPNTPGPTFPAFPDSSAEDTVLSPCAPLKGRAWCPQREKFLKTQS